MCEHDTSRARRTAALCSGLVLLIVLFFRRHVIVFEGEGVGEANVNMRHPGRFTGVIGSANV